jgi:branched-chain amino acid transport system substrate-binding protein
MLTRFFRFVACALAFAFGILAPAAQAQPIRIGMGISQTGALGSGGKSALLALRMWAEDVNAKGGLLGRKVELVVYDDQSNPSTTPGIYTKLIDVDKVDLLIGPYASVPTAPIMPLIKQRDLLLMTNFTFKLNRELKHDKAFNNSPWSNEEDLANPVLQIGRAAGAKTIAILAADQEFAQNLAGGAKNIANRMGLKIVYEQNYPPSTVDFSSMIRAIRSARPDIVYVCSYPNDSVGILRAVKEIGVGDSVRVFGGGMVGLQFTPVIAGLGPLANGVVNFASYGPGETMNFPGIRDFLERYSKRAAAENVDPLGFYLPPFTYAIGQMLAQAVTATKSLNHKVLAEYLHRNELQTIVGPIRFNELGERAVPAVPLVQYQSLAEKDVEQFRKPERMVIVHPAQFKTGEAVVPFEKARK